MRDSKLRYIMDSTIRKVVFSMGNVTTSESGYDLYNDRTAHRSAIKKRIVKAVAESGYTPYYIYHKVNGGSTNGGQTNALYDYGLSYPTFLRTCNPDYPNICNLDSCLAIARFLKLPLDSLFSPPGEELQLNASRITTYPAEPFNYLTNQKYYGTFYGYMHSVNNEEKDIEPFTLCINEHGATMRLHYHTTESDNKREPRVTEYAGRPIQTEHNIHMVLTSCHGDFMILAFAYRVYKDKDLYFRHGGLLASGRGNSVYPHAQSFLLFDHDIQRNEKQYLPGLLLLSDRDFHIPVSVAEDLAEKDPDVRRFFDELAHHLTKEEYYMIREETMISCDNERISKDKIISALLKMKAKATDAKHAYYPHMTPYSRFSLILKKILTDE